ncbi:hypothetical protein [Trinickia diaoshuihuensis]|uniref:hypothetical protein n=1 Tax=Trinickia diaoshuihuensis TaxID=2292265 RepID=UPI000E2684FB|nr:hypothetical protein [Trinickia diaoshuihuensis]
MNEHDHFSSVLDVESIEEPLEPHFDGHAEFAADDEEAQLHEQQAPRKKPIPKALLLVGGMVAFVVVGVGYQHFFGQRPQSGASSGMLGTASADAGDTPLPTGTAITQQSRNGMLTPSVTVPPLPNRMLGQASEPVGAMAIQQTSGEMSTRSAMPASVASIASVAPAGDDTPQDSAGATYRQGAGVPAIAAQGAPIAAPGVAGPAAPGVVAMTPASSAAGAAAGLLAANVSTVAGSDAPSPVQAATAPDPRDAQIAKLQAQVAELQRRDHAVDGVSAPAHSAAHRVGNHAVHSSSTAHAHAAGSAATSRGARYARHPERANSEVLVGYAIKQVIPGQGWIQDEESGKQQVVAVGDFIGTAKVVRIDPDNYRIVTTAGVIQ